MSRRSIAVDLPRDPTGLARSVAGSALLLLATVYIGRMTADQSAHVRDLLAVLLAGTLVVVALRTPQVAILATLAFLPFLELVRRWLIPYGGWQSHDPLLLVGPAVAIVLALHYRSARRGAGLSRMVAALLFLAVVESVNPLGGSIQSGVVGLLFVGAPLVWFFVGRDLVDRRTAAGVLWTVIAAAVVVSLYGLAQSEGHFTSWDQAWIAEGHLGSLNVGGTIRAFGTFASSAEYAAFLGIAVVVCIAAALHGHVYALALVPLLGTALFLEGSRGSFVLVLCASIALIGLRTRRIGAAVVTIALTLALVVATWHRIGNWASTQGQQSGNALVQHQIGGLEHPLDQQQSTLIAHWHLFVNGFKGVLDHPVGLGTGSTNIAGGNFGGTQAGTEIDVSNMFVALGIPGGVLFVLIVLTTLRRSFAVYRTHGDIVGLAALGILLVCLGQWLNGGYYAVSPLVWIVAGWFERRNVTGSSIAAGGGS